MGVTKEHLSSEEDFFFFYQLSFIAGSYRVIEYHEAKIFYSVTGWKSHSVLKNLHAFC